MQFLQDKSTGSIVLLAYYSDLIKTIFTRTEYVSTEESNENFFFLPLPQHKQAWWQPCFSLHYLWQFGSVSVTITHFQNFLEKKIMTDTSPFPVHARMPRILCPSASQPSSQAIVSPSLSLLTASTMASFTQHSCFCHLPTILVVKFEKAQNKAELVSL